MIIDMLMTIAFALEGNYKTCESSESQQFMSVPSVPKSHQLVCKAAKDVETHTNIRKNPPPRHHIDHLSLTCRYTSVASSLATKVTPSLVMLGVCCSQSQEEHQSTNNIVTPHFGQELRTRSTVQPNMSSSTSVCPLQPSPNANHGPELKLVAPTYVQKPWTVHLSFPSLSNREPTLPEHFQELDTCTHTHTHTHRWPLHNTLPWCLGGKFIFVFWPMVLFTHFSHPLAVAAMFWSASSQLQPHATGKTQVHRALPSHALGPPAPGQHIGLKAHPTLGLSGLCLCHPCGYAGHWGLRLQMQLLPHRPMMRSHPCPHPCCLVLCPCCWQPLVQPS